VSPPPSAPTLCLRQKKKKRTDDAVVVVGSNREKRRRASGGAVRPAPKRPSDGARLSFTNFGLVIADLALKCGYQSVCDIDASGAVKVGNRVSALTTTKYQNRAQYGRFLPPATEEIFDLVGLAAHHTFLDIGSGIGLVAIQAAATRGCRARGLELMAGRMRIAEELRRGLRASVRRVDDAVDGEDLQRRIELRRGDLTDPAHLEFLTAVDVVFVNNYECIFAARSGGGTKAANLDDHVAALFSKMPVGSRCVTLEPLYTLGKSRTQANENRTRRGLLPRDDASFFEYRQVSSRLDPSTITSWGSTGAPQLLYHIYTRVGLPHSQAGFLCPNDDCDTHKTRSLIPATYESRPENGVGLLRDACPICKQIRDRPVRRRNVKKKVEWTSKGEIAVPD